MNARYIIQNLGGGYIVAGGWLISEKKKKEWERSHSDSE